MGFVSGKGTNWNSDKFSLTVLEKVELWDLPGIWVKVLVFRISAASFFRSG